MHVRAGPWQQHSRGESLEMRCYRKFMNIFCKDHVTNEEVRNRIQNATGVYGDLLTMVKKNPGNSDGMATSQDPLAWWRQFYSGQWKEQEEEENRRRDGKITSRILPGMGFGDSLRSAEDRERWKCIVATSSVCKVKGLRWNEKQPA